MKLDKLVKTLRRDLAANPMKAGVLGVLLLGGLYFWGPLVWKWVGKKGSVDASAAAVIPTPAQTQTGAPSPGVQTVSGGEANKETGFAWREIRGRREADPLARSANFRPEWSQIFQVATATTVANPESEVAKAAAKQVEVDPRKFGLVLQGVAIGSKTKKAIINGKVYRELDVITVSKTTDQPEYKLRLVRVSRKLVEVEYGGKTWPLKLGEAESEKLQPAKPMENETQDEPEEEKAVTPVKKKAVTAEE